MTALADSVLDSSDEEVLEEAQLNGDSAESTRETLLDGVKLLKKQRLADARAQYEAAAASMTAPRSSRIPTSLREMRDLLRSLLEARPQLQPALTAQFRDFAELSDEDVEGFLRQLDALGVLDEYLKDKR
jgi:hypothetical protein